MRRTTIINIAKILAVSLTISIIITPTITAQQVAGWELRVDKPFYFVGEEMNITVEGPADTIYSLFLYNITTWGYTHVQTREIGPLGRDSFDASLDYDWVAGGFFTLNLTVDDYLVDFVEIEIQLDEDFLHEKKHNWLDRFSRWVEKTITDLALAMQVMKDDIAQYIRINLLETAVLFIIGGQVILHVIYPRFHSWAIQKRRKKDYKRARKGIPAGIIQWHDKEILPLPAVNEPNINKIAVRLIDVGCDPATAKTVMWDSSGDAGQADLIRDTVAHIRRKRAMRKAAKKVLTAKEEALLAAAWFQRQAGALKYKKAKAVPMTRLKEIENIKKLDKIVLALLYSAYFVSGLLVFSLWFRFIAVIFWLLGVLAIDIYLKRTGALGIYRKDFICPECSFEGTPEMKICPVCDGWDTGGE
jgi:hypothetical protein